MTAKECIAMLLHRHVVLLSHCWITHQPRLTQVPPTSSPEKTAVFKLCALECKAAPCPPTPHPMIATSKSNSVEASSDIRMKVAGLLTLGEEVNADEAGMRRAKIAKRDKIAIFVYVLLKSNGLGIEFCLLPRNNLPALASFFLDS